MDGPAHKYIHILQLEPPWIGPSRLRSYLDFVETRYATGLTELKIPWQISSKFGSVNPKSTRVADYANHMTTYTPPPLCVVMGFYADISWESRCNIKINVLAHYHKILKLFEVP